MTAPTVHMRRRILPAVSDFTDRTVRSGADSSTSSERPAPVPVRTIGPAKTVRNEERCPTSGGRRRTAQRGVLVAEPDSAPPRAASSTSKGTVREHSPAARNPAAPAQPPARKSWFARHKILTGLGAVIVAIVAITAVSGGSGDRPSDAARAAGATTGTAEAPRTPGSVRRSATASSSSS
ncbi:hypothetical protein P9209_29565 [Prescottella defluvii]|nr:hypothetical protein P9209_29565 [Prescottella defluvii]